MNRVNPLYWLLLIVFQFSTLSLLRAQEMDYRTTFTDAEYYFLFNDFAEALPLYKKALEQKPDNANLNYRIGLCYLNILGQKHNAIPYLEAAVKNITSNYQEGSYKETKAPKNAYFYLGEAYRVVENIDKAIEAYNTFRELIDTKDVYSLDYVDQQIQACQRAIKMMEEPINIDLKLIKLFDNEKYIYSQVVSADGKTMAFTTQEKFYDAIYISRKKDNGQWGNPVNITLDLTVEGEIFTTSLSPDGNTIYLFKNDRGIGNVYKSNFENDKWQPVTRLGKNISSRNWETGASISPDGHTLFFSSNRKGGYGGLDIYFCKLLPNGEWGDPQNIGSTINTPYNEEAPFLTPDGNTLYFVSQGHNSIGGYDIFYSERIGENEWSVPINLGYPINTTDDDLSYYPLDNDNALVSLVKKGSPDVRNIYLLSIKPGSEQLAVNVEGIITLTNNFEVQSDKFSLELIDVINNEVLQKKKPEDVSGKFFFEVKPGLYRLIVKGEGYTEKVLPLYIPDDFSQSSYPVDIQMIPEKVASGEVLEIRSILFEFDCDKLNREAAFELEKVFGIMNKYPSLTIEVCGHTDSKGTASYNYKLSLRRAQSVIDYLIGKGIHKERMVARGASDLENVAVNLNPDGTDNPEGRSLNRRAAISVLKSDENIEIQENLSIPEHLKPRQQPYTILLSPINYPINAVSEARICKHVGQQTRKLVGPMGQFAHTIGSYDHKSQAIALLNYAIDNGFPESTIIGERDLQVLLSIPTSTVEESVKPDEGVYTIQIMASKEPIEDASVFKGLNVKEVKSESGIYQYIFGEFKGKNAAKEELEKIKLLGFTEAFIMNINRYKE